ncbi:hypothetical protein IWQ62_003149 [Dispira parvispora]|uniref:ZZ-type domain-containing protein n=1 Tax=Dispira parvispora TaxID=1520584 RepID=A0A9W8AVC9_9FUNG|nr:hypothetical protein IWQ62_003149 [Dispira parvispora]
MGTLTPSADHPNGDVSRPPRQTLERTLLGSALAVLENQLEQATRDIKTLQTIRENALNDPFAFVQSIKDKKLERFPKQQRVLRIPDIDWSTLLSQHSDSTAPSTPALCYTTPRTGLRIHQSTVFPDPASDQTCEKSSHGLPHTNATGLLKGITLSNGDRLSLSTTNVTNNHVNSPVSQSVPGSPTHRAKQSRLSHLDLSTPSSWPSTPHNEPREGLNSQPSDLSFPQPSPVALKGVSEEHTPVSDGDIPWTAEENRRLQELMVIFPEENTARQRYKKISGALGTRTLQQVSKRIQLLTGVPARTGRALPGTRDLHTPTRARPKQAGRARGASPGVPRNTRTSITPGRRSMGKQANLADDDSGDSDYGPSKKRQRARRKPSRNRETHTKVVSGSRSSRTSGYLYNVPLASLHTIVMSDDDQVDGDQKRRSSHAGTNKVGGSTRGSSRRSSIGTNTLPVDHTSSNNYPQKGLGVGKRPEVSKPIVCCAQCHCRLDNGPRWLCLDCPSEANVAFCIRCVLTPANITVETHNDTHELRELGNAPGMPYYYDKDYSAGQSEEFSYLG